VKLRVIFLVFALWSYEISTLLMYLFEGSIYMSHLIRITTVIIGLFLIYNQKHRLRYPSIFELALLVFLAIYLFRILVDTFYFNLDASVGNSKYILIHIFSNIVPVIIFGFIPYQKGDVRLFFTYTISLMTLVICIAIISGLSEYLISIALNSHGSNRLISAKISPIQLGHYGVSLFLLLYVGKNGDVVHRILRIAMYAVSLVAIVLGNSKGPVVALCLVIVIDRFRHSNSSVVFIKNLTFVVMFAIISWFILRIGFGIDLLDRFYGITKSTDTSTVSRLQSYREAIQLFIESPFIGSQFITNSGGYPHNIILEALMSTGLIGTSLLIYTLYKALTIESNVFKDTISIYLLLVQWLIAFMFSFSLYQAVIVFVCMAVLLNIRNEKKCSVLL
jgi:O-antigen ligase